VIARRKLWQEEWIYGSSIAGERYLYFVNTVLVDAVDKASADRLARLTPPRHASLHARRDRLRRGRLTH
jgi:hypothetical protein